MATLSTPRFLVVDDEPAIRRALIRLLQKQGYVCRGAASGEEARTLLTQEQFTLVVTDLRMWGEEGLELVRHIADEYPETGSIVLTGLTDGNLEERARRAGAYALISKGTNPEKVLAEIAEALSKHEEVVKVRRHQTW